MNYIKEINAFYDCIERDPLSGSAVALWHALMHINNKAMWRKTFTVAAPVLRLKSGLKESSFKRARAELHEKGYVAYESRGRNQAAEYRMIGLSWSGDVDYGRGACLSEGGVALGSGGNGVVDSGEAHTSRDCSRAAVNSNESGVASSDVAVGASERGVHSSERAANSSEDGLHSSDRAVGSSENAVYSGDDFSYITDNTLQAKESFATRHESNQEVDHLANEQVNHNVNRNVTHLMTHQPDHEMNHPTDHHTAPLVKQYETKANQTKQTNTTAADADAFVFYQNNFGPISPFMSDSLMNWVDDVGEALVVDAMKRAVERGKSNWSYVKAILQAWAKNGITTVEDAKAEEAAFHRRRQQGRGGPSYAARTEEVIPDWFREQKRQEKRNQERDQAEDESRDKTAEWEETERLLAKFG